MASTEVSVAPNDFNSDVAVYVMYVLSAESVPVYGKPPDLKALFKAVPLRSAPVLYLAENFIVWEHVVMKSMVVHDLVASMHAKPGDVIVNSSHRLSATP